MQDALIDAYHDLERLRDPAAFPSWFRRVVFTRCTRVLRDRSRSRRLIPFEEIPEEPATEPDLDAVLDQGKLQDILNRIIRELPDGQRDVTRLFYLSGYSQKEIAALLEIPVTTVKKRLQYARTRIRTRMTDLYKPGELAVLLDYRPGTTAQVAVTRKRSIRQMDIHVTLATQEDAYILQNLYPLFLHDISEFDQSWRNQVPNEYGILEPNNPNIRTLTEHGALFNSWLEKPGILFPFLIRVDNLPAGFIYVATHPHVPTSADYEVYAAFLLHRYRGSDVGIQAVRDVVNRLHGRWEVTVLLNNPRALGFWRKAITACMSDRFEEFDGPTHHDFNSFSRIFRFINMDIPEDDPHMAAYHGDVHTLTRHLDNGLSVDTRSAYGWEATLLHWAAIGGQPEAVELLLTLGAKPEADDLRERQPLNWAIQGHWLGYPQGDRVRVAEILLEAGADANVIIDMRISEMEKTRNMSDMLDLFERYGVKVA